MKNIAYRDITLALYVRMLNKNTTATSAINKILKLLAAKRAQDGFISVATPIPNVVNKPTTIHRMDPFSR